MRTHKSPNAQPLWRASIEGNAVNGPGAISVNSRGTAVIYSNIIRSAGNAR